MADEVAYNPFDPSFHADPYPHYRDLLAGPPRRLALRVPVVLVARYADVVAVTRDHATFSSALPPLLLARGPDPCGGAMTMPFSVQPAADSAARAAHRRDHPAVARDERRGRAVRGDERARQSAAGGDYRGDAGRAQRASRALPALVRRGGVQRHGQESRRIRGPRGVGVARIPGAGNRAAAGRSRG